MPKGTNQKFKLYRLAQIMLEKTDDEHYITMPEIMKALATYEVTADRKSIYNDLCDLEKLVSKYEAIKLQRQVYVSGRIKAMNESIYYNVDAIHNAISENKKIRF